MRQRVKNRGKSAVFSFIVGEIVLSGWQNYVILLVTCIFPSNLKPKLVIRY